MSNLRTQNKLAMKEHRATNTYMNEIARLTCKPIHVSAIAVVFMNEDNITAQCVSSAHTAHCTIYSV